MTSKKLILTSRKILITSLLCGMIWPTFARENFSPSTNLEYASLEHLMLGADLKLHFIDMNGQSYDQNGSNVVIKQVASSDKSLFPITYAKMIYLAGDFIADPNLNISGDKSNPDNNYSLVQLKSNFLQNFNYFDGYFQGEYSGASKFLVGDFLPKIEAIVNDQLEKNKQNIINHKPLSQLDGEDFSFNCATGGKCSSQLDLLKKQGLYMAVSSKGGDHFSKYAITNYLTGHRLALETAALAKNEEALKKAYAYEAYADHYLTDAFSSGHQRTPIVDFMNLSNEKELNTLFNLPIIKNILISQGITKEYILLAENPSS